MAKLLLVFDFSIKQERRTNFIETPIERQQAIVSFALPYELDLCVHDATHISTKKTDGGFIYLFEFETLNGAIDFTESPSVRVLSTLHGIMPDDLESEMAEFMSNYSATKKKHKKKRLVEDGDGFVHYE